MVTVGRLHLEQRRHSPPAAEKLGNQTLGARTTTTAIADKTAIAAGAARAARAARGTKIVVVVVHTMHAPPAVDRTATLVRVEAEIETSQGDPSLVEIEAMAVAAAEIETQVVAAAEIETMAVAAAEIRDETDGGRDRRY